jgi:hypothetical protein
MDERSRARTDGTGGRPWLRWCLVGVGFVAGLGGCRTESEESLRLRLAVLQAEREAAHRASRPPAQELPEGLAEIEGATPEEVFARARDRILQDASLREQVLGPRNPGGGGSTEPRFEANARALAHSNWVWNDPSDASRWQGLSFGSSWMIVRGADEVDAAFTADLSGFAPECMGVGLCVLVVADGRPVARHFVLDGEALRPVECVNFELVGDGGAPPTDEALLETSNMIVSSRRGSVLCMRHRTAPAFRRVPGALPIE